MSELDPLPPDLADLFADERASYPADEVARDRVRRRLEASIAFGALGAAGVGLGAAAVKTGFGAQLALHLTKYAKLYLALTFAAGLAVGETHARVTAASAPVAAPSAVVTAAPTSTAAAAPTIPVVDLSALPSVTPPPSATGSGAGAAAPVAPASTLSAEQALVDTARAAVSRGRPDDALRAVAEHGRRFPGGRLAEERELLAVQALLLADRRSEADARAHAFHVSYPASLYGGAIDALLGPRQDAGR